MMQLTATVDQDLWAVKLVATGATGTVEWFRRSGGVNTPIGSGTVLWDYTADLNRTFEYVAADDVDSDTVGPVRIDADAPVLSSSMSAIARAVQVVDYRPLSGQGRTRWHPVLGRPDPIVTVHRALYPSGLLRLSVPTPAERQALIDLLRLGEPLLLRSTCPERVDTMTFVMQNWQDPFAGRGRKHGPAYLDIDFQQVSAFTSIAPPDPDRTYQTILDQHATYAEVLQVYTDYRHVLDGFT